MTQQHEIDLRVVSVAEALGAEALVSLDGLSREDIKLVGEMTMWAMLANLFEMGLAQSEDDRSAAAMVFASIVEHQQQLMKMLEDKHGIELHVDKPNAITLTMSRRDCYHLGHHDVLMREIRAIQKAKEQGELNAYARKAWSRLSAHLKSLCQEAKHLHLPVPEFGWLPERQQFGKSSCDWIYIWADVGDGEAGMISVVARVPINQYQKGEAQVQ